MLGEVVVPKGERILTPHQQNRNLPQVGEGLFTPEEAVKRHMVTAIRRTAIEAAFVARTFTPTQGELPQDEIRRRTELADNRAGAVIRYGYQTSPEVIDVVAGEGAKDNIDPVIGTFGGMNGHSEATLSAANDPVDYTKALIYGRPGAISVHAITTKDGYQPLPDEITHMWKLLGPRGTEAMDLDADPEDNIRIAAESRGVPVSSVVVLGLDRPGVNDHFVQRALAYGAQVETFDAGDIVPSFEVVTQSRFEKEGKIYIYIGMRGGAEEGLITAAAALVAGAHMQGRLHSKHPEVNERYGRRKLGLNDLISGDPNHTFVAWSTITPDERWFTEMEGVDLYPAYGRSPRVSTALLDINGLRITRTNTPRIIIPSEAFPQNSASVSAIRSPII